MHPKVVKSAIKGVLDIAHRQTKFTNNLPGEKWFQFFLGRHPKIGLKNSEVLTKSRASVTEQNIRDWFTDFKAYIAAEGASEILLGPSRIYNLEETGVQLCPKNGKLLGLKSEKNMYCISPGQDKQNITVLCCYGADCTGIAPMIVYPYSRFPPKDIAASVSDEFVIGHSPSGWMTMDLCYKYIVNGFHKELVDQGIQFPVLLLFDGHSSHMSLALHDFCVKKKIILYCLYPNTTHIMQPCDVGIFRPLKKCWKEQVSLHAQSSNKPISKVNFDPIFKLAYEKSCDPKVIKKAFECCGLFPCNPDIIDYSKCMSNRHKIIRDKINSEKTQEIVDQ
ncbi:uncharacterized protein LOC106657828 [Trichogramma pretiosum]|uniref:uncharacterized protein LOC106657828 n=1 Tax=Trichogramma pretiosum TaxID=7493 RepID=UPI0006C9D3E0|nr:uncharacterized protein LOC106657828 [Trichogramma pretiosum]